MTRKHSHSHSHQSHAPQSSQGHAAHTATVRWPLKMLFGMHALSMLLIILAMTPLTHNLDDIKVLLFFIGGPLLMLTSLFCIWTRCAWGPPWPVTAGLVAYGCVLVISTLHSKYSFEGWYQCVFVWSAIGVFMSSCCLASVRRTSEWYFRWVLIMVLLMTLTGVFMFDFSGTADKHYSGVGWLYRVIYGSQGTNHYSPLRSLLLTLHNADGVMQSTILNRDFYAAICLLYFPITLLMALDPGHTHRPNLWRILGLCTMVLCLVSIFYCQSKGEYGCVVVDIILFAAVFSRIGRIPHLRKQYMVAWLAGFIVLMGVLAWMKAPTFARHLKSFDVSVESREIIWSGSYNIFKDYPILGGGPGTFKIYFPNYRRPDYFNHEISNVTLYSHNYFLDLLCETGVVGAGAFFFFLGALFLMGAKVVWSHPNSRLKMLSAASMIALIGMYGSNMSSPNGRWVIGGSSLWATMGYLAGLITQARRTDMSEDPAHLLTPHGNKLSLPLQWAVGLTTLLGVFMMYEGTSVGVNYFRGAKNYATALRYMEPAYNLLRSNSSDAAIDKVEELLSMASYHYGKSAENNPTHYSTYYKQASIYTTRAQIERQRAASLMAEKKYEEASNHTNYAQKYLQLARETYETLASLSPDYAEIHYNLGIVYQESSRMLRSQAQAKAKDDPQAAEILEKEAENYENKALEHLDRMSKMSIKKEVALLHAQQLVSMDYVQRAVEVYAKACDIYPTDKDLLERYFVAANQCQDNLNMARALEKLWKTQPLNDQYLNRLLLTLYEGKEGDSELAQRVLAHMESVNPIDPRLFEFAIKTGDVQGSATQILAAIDRYHRVGGTQRDLYEKALQSAKAQSNSEMAQKIEDWMSELK